jgi:hypothetical protein
MILSAQNRFEGTGLLSLSYSVLGSSFWSMNISIRVRSDVRNLLKGTIERWQG